MCKSTVFHTLAAPSRAKQALNVRSATDLLPTPLPFLSSILLFLLTPWVSSFTLFYSLSLKDRGIPTFLGRHGNAAARKKERPQEEGGGGWVVVGGGGLRELGGFGWEGGKGDEAGDVWTMWMLPQWSSIAPPPQQKTNKQTKITKTKMHSSLSSSIFCNAFLPYCPQSFKTQPPHSAVIVIIIIIGSFSRQRWYPRQPGEVALVPWWIPI